MTLSKTIKAVGASALLGLGLMGLVGCSDTVTDSKPKERDYLLKFDLIGISPPIALTSGDFDNDGDLDLILGASYGNGYLYFFENDGKGNFSKRMYK